MPIPLHWTQLRGRRGRWLLDLEWIRGGVLRFAEERITVSSDDGDLVFLAGLARISVSLAVGVSEVPITIQTTDVDWLDGWRRGGSLERLPARLWRWYEGSAYEDARLVVDGLLVSVSAADPSSPGTLSGTLAVEVLAESLTPDQVMRWEDLRYHTAGGSEVWAMREDSPSNGAYRPVVVGRPGSPGGNAAVPAYELNLTASTLGPPATISPSWLLAGHALLASSVRLWDMEGGSLGITQSPPAYLPSTYPDRRDQVFSQILRLTNDSPWNPTTETTAAERVNTGRKFWWGLTTTDALSNPYRDGGLRGLGDVLRWWYEYRGGRKVDGGSCEAFSGPLNQYKIDFAWTSPVTTDAWIEAEVLRVYPVRVIQGPRGVYFRRRTYQATDADVVATLSTRGLGIEVAASSPLTPVDVSLVSHVRVEYGHQTLSDYLYVAEIGIQPSTVAVESYASVLAEGGAHLAEIAAANFGARTATLQVPTTWDATTANLVALDYLDRESLPRYRRTYQGGTEIEGLAVGDVVALDDEDLSPDQVRLATVEDVRLGGSLVTITVEILRDPLAYTVPTS